MNSHTTRLGCSATRSFLRVLGFECTGKSWECSKHCIPIGSTNLLSIVNLPAMRGKRRGTGRELGAEPQAWGPTRMGFRAAPGAWGGATTTGQEGERGKPSHAMKTGAPLSMRHGGDRNWPFPFMVQATMKDR